MLSLFDLEFDQDEALSCPYIARRINPGEIEDFQVFGERNSGTNFTASLIAKYILGGKECIWVETWISCFDGLQAKFIDCITEPDRLGCKHV